MQTVTKKRLQVNITQDMLYPSALVPIRAKTFIGKMCSLYRFIFMEIELICMKTCFETEA